MTEGGVDGRRCFPGRSLENKTRKTGEEEERGNWKGGGTERKPEGPLKLINGSSCTSSERARCVLRGLKSSSIRQMREQEGGFKW